MKWTETYCVVPGNCPTSDQHACRHTNRSQLSIRHLLYICTHSPLCTWGFISMFGSMQVHFIRTRVSISHRRRRRPNRANTFLMHFRTKIHSDKFMHADGSRRSFNVVHFRFSLLTCKCVFVCVSVFFSLLVRCCSVIYFDFSSFRCSHSHSLAFAVH